MAFGFGGAIGSLLSNPKTERKVYDLGIAQEGAGYLDRLRDTGARNIASESEYDALLKGAAKKVSGLEAGDMDTYSQLLSRATQRDPIGDQSTLLNTYLAGLKSVGADLAGYGRKSNNATLAALGYGGRGPGSYETNLMANRISSNLAPVAAGIFANIPNAANTAQNAYMQNLGAALDLINKRAAVPYRGTMNPVDVANFRNANLGSDVARFGDLARIQRENVAGFETKDNKWANMFNSLGETEGAILNAATQLASAYLGGGGGANPVAAPQPAAPTFQPVYQPSQTIAQQPAFYGGQTVSPYPQTMPSPYPTAAPPPSWASAPPPWYAATQGGFGWTGGY